MRIFFFFSFFRNVYGFKQNNGEKYLYWFLSLLHEYKNSHRIWKLIFFSVFIQCVENAYDMRNGNMQKKKKIHSVIIIEIYHSQILIAHRTTFIINKSFAWFNNVQIQTHTKLRHPFSLFHIFFSLFQKISFSSAILLHISIHSNQTNAKFL